MINPDRIAASPVATGSGKVRCAHGILPVPAPATEILLRGIPSYSGDQETELTTPTGAALLKYYVEKYEKRPLMSVDNIGIGCGNKNFPEANVIRAFLGEEKENKANDRIIELNTNIDDMTPEDTSYAVKKIFEAGALDVFTSNIMMKKGRNGILITVLLKDEDEDKIVKAIFHNTTTIGIRKKVCDRYIKKSDFSEIDYAGEKVRIKTSRGYGETNVKPEYEDLERIAEKLEQPTYKIRQEITRRIQ
jgi:pyridinium-3,5-bisthiocarboxylic acid mononucleotide nickel chelatase